LRDQRSGGGFVLGGTPVRKRMQAKLRQIKEQLKTTRHDGVEAQGDSDLQNYIKAKTKTT
jgi:hypothetical protein